MPTASLPTHPQLHQLRQQAKALQRGVRSGDAAALARVEERYPGGVPADLGGFSLTTAQLVVAREYGFSSWAKLKHYVQTVTDFRWDVVPPGREVVGEFCWLACLTYSEQDGPERWARARALLAEHPMITDYDVYAAAVAADVATVRRRLAEEPAVATRRDGPHRWSPLFYLAYSRLDPDVPAEPVLEIAQLLLEAGADPNEGYLWNGQPYVFTLLAGVFGEGEQGPVRQPPHPHAAALARLLLEAGADPNDDQALYNRMFRPANDHLELLFEFGLGTGDGGRWQERMGHLHATPAEKLRNQLRWAIEHNFGDRVRLLARHGVDIVSPYPDGRTPIELSELYGAVAASEALRSAGAGAAQLDAAGELIAAAFRGDASAVAAVRAAHPSAAEQVLTSRPGLLVWAAAEPGRAPVVELLVSLGYDVNSYGRGDAPAEGEWETALHQAAHRGDVELARTLLTLGADPNLRDNRFYATPLGWARHANRTETIALLHPLTEDGA